jgi:hypothetical protein
MQLTDETIAQLKKWRKMSKQKFTPYCKNFNMTIKLPAEVLRMLTE